MSQEQKKSSQPADVSAAKGGEEPAAPRMSHQDTNDIVQLSREEYETLSSKAAELTELKDRFLRSAADFENAKKRLMKDKEDYFKFALEGLIYELLSVLDNFELAMGHSDPQDPKIKPVYEGLKLIHKQLSSVLADHGLKRVESTGKMFDPHVHEAVEYVDHNSHDEGMIISESLAGYELNGKLIRPAKVRVAKKSEPSFSEEKEDELT